MSVLLPVRNAASTLAPALQSLQDQTLKNIEIVAVDHASTDGSGSLLRQARRGDSRIRVLHQPGGNLLDALNRGLAACRAPWVARADADDLSHPDRLRAQLGLARKDKLELVASQVRIFAEGSVQSGYRHYERWVNSLVASSRIRRDLLVECPLPHPTWLVRRDLYRRLGAYREAALPEDYHFVLRAAEAGAAMGKVRRHLVSWRDHPARHSRNHARYHLNAFFDLKARFVERLFLRGRPCIVWGIGGRGRKLARSLKRQGTRILMGIKDIEEGSDRSLRGAPVVVPQKLPTPLPAPLLACVGTPGARESIRHWCRSRRLREWHDFIFVN